MLTSSEDSASQNERSLSTLARAIALSQGQFALILVHCNYIHLRERFLTDLRRQYNLEVKELVLSESAKTLYLNIEAEIKDHQPYGLIVLGLESVTAIDGLLTATNQVRDEFRRKFSFPLVLWLNDEVLAKVVKLAPDFYSWAGVPIKFTITTDELIAFLQQEADSLFTKVLDAGADRFVDNSILNLNMSAGKRFALKSALTELENRGSSVPALTASQQFILARDAYANNEMERSQQLYEQSLSFWQENCDLERQACLLFHLGLWWRRYAVLHQADSQSAFYRAKDYYQQCVQICQQANRPDLAAKFINALGEVLQQLQQWHELEIVTKIAIELHENYPHHLRLAYTYGLVAEIALAKKNWQEAKQYAEIALETNAQSLQSFDTGNLDTYLSWAQEHYRSWYNLLLALAQQQLRQIPAALQNLETAKLECKREYNPQLYLRILAALRTMYFEQGRYLEAFRIKKKQLRVEQRYGLRAFIGASRLAPQQQIVSPSLILLNNADLSTEATLKVEFNPVHIAEEIEASGRKQDVDSLIERISRNDHKLIVIHGLSGVGKSSLLTAGLIPALWQKNTINGRNILPVIVRFYTDWVRDLGMNLAKSISSIETPYLQFPSANLDSVDGIIKELGKNLDRNLLTVLIFDQFEELFFNCPKLAERMKFWEFLHLCLDSVNIPYVKVILSIREDNLHYLLECDRLINLEVTKNDILNKKIRYHFGNFSTENAKNLIQNLTKNSLEPALINELVKDLAGDLGEVRPIELQVIGAQLQEEKITNLKQYQRLGYTPKVELVERYLAQVIADCGSEENRNLAQLVLYLLTDESGTRPLKTRHELVADLEAAGLAAETKKLNLVLEILVGSGIVFLVVESPADRYQLVHDYLVTFIRQQQGAKLLQDLRKTRKLAEELQAAQSDALSRYSEALFSQNKELESLIEAIRAGRALRRQTAKADIQIRVLTAIQQAVYGVRESNRLETHDDEVNSITFSPDGDILASASKDNTIKIWTREGEELWTISGHNSPVTSISFSPDGKAIASGSADKTIKLWTLEGKEIRTFEEHSASVTSVCFSPDGKAIASSSADKTIKLWSLENQAVTTFEGHNGSVISISFSPDGKAIASASADKTIKLWSLENEETRTFIGHTALVISINFSPDGKIIVSGSGDKTIKLWSLEGKELRTLKGHINGVNSIVFSPDSKTIASASDDNTIKIWSLEGKELITLKGHTNGVNSVSFSPDGKTVASASDDKTIKLWNLEAKELTILKKHTARVNSVSFSPDGKTLASCGYDNNIKLWSSEGKEIRTLKGHSIWVNSVTFSPDGQTIASGSLDNTIKLWTIEGKELITIEGHSVWINSVSFSPDGKIIASASHDKTIKLWSFEGTPLLTLKGHKYGVNSAIFSPDGQTIASASDDKTIKVWNLEGRELMTLNGHNAPVNSVTFSPNGQIIGSASKDNTIKLWNLEGIELKTLKGHNAPVNSITFSPDGKILASGSYDNTVKLWTLEGKELKTLNKHSDPVNSISFSPDGKAIASASHDKTVILWNLNLDTLLECGCNWVRHYLKNNPNTESDRHLCDGIGNH